MATRGQLRSKKIRKKSQKKIGWFWMGGGVRRAGPYKSPLEASDAAQHIDGRGPVPGFSMWCEEL